jgi:hypothetical protein
MNRRAVALLSGGLDSALAVHLVKRQGIEVTGLHFTSFFAPADPDQEDSPVNATARCLGVDVVYKRRGEDFNEILRNPRYGFGKNLNPCIDCRIYSLIKARDFLAEIGASFLVTGEVVGQRPMSQRRDAIRLIEKRAGCDGIVLRPLSAKVLPPTRPELEGIVIREELFDITGRGRKVQIALAEEIGLTGYSSPAGGCLLTDGNFSDRLRDLMDHGAELTQDELESLTVGRHLRLRPGLKVVVGRKHAENERLEEIAKSGLLFFPIGFPGPAALALGNPDAEEEKIIGSIILRYAKKASGGQLIGIRGPSIEERAVRVDGPADEDWIADLII